MCDATVHQREDIKPGVLPLSLPVSSLLISSSAAYGSKKRSSSDDINFPHTLGVSCGKELSAALSFAHATRNVSISE